MAVGCAIVAYDGSPFAPMSVLWDLVDEHGCARAFASILGPEAESAHSITDLGLSPRYAQVLLSANYSPKRDHRLDTLRSVTFAGAPCKPELYDFVRREIKPVFFANVRAPSEITLGKCASHT
jgi:acetoacetyl-CoA synthetase